MKERSDSTSNTSSDIVAAETVVAKNGKGEPDQQSLATVKSKSAESKNKRTTVNNQNKPNRQINLSQSQLIVIALSLMVVGLWFRLPWLGLTSALFALLLSLGVVLNSVKVWVTKFLTIQERRTILAFIGFISAIAGLCNYLGVYRNIGSWLNQFKYDEFGSWADWIGALGQISIAILAVYVAWAQYVISRDLTIQQNRITQQQTIDTYFQGISDLTLNDEGLLEDWPQERAVAEGRTASILSSIDENG
ncbi:MAG: low-complexity protein, partial [Cyanobacteria bacterium J06642_3]